MHLTEMVVIRREIITKRAMKLNIKGDRDCQIELFTLILTEKLLQKAFYEIFRFDFLQVALNNSSGIQIESKCGYFDADGFINTLFSRAVFNSSWRFYSHWLKFKARKRPFKKQRAQLAAWRGDEIDRKKSAVLLVGAFRHQKMRRALPEFVGINLKEIIAEKDDSYKEC